jgi:hypothetical protein
MHPCAKVSIFRLLLLSYLMLLLLFCEQLPFLCVSLPHIGISLEMVKGLEEENSNLQASSAKSAALSSAPYQLTG